MIIHPNQFIGEIVAQNHRASSIFRKHGIDFWCQGDRTINDAYTDYRVDTKLVLRELDESINITNTDIADYKTWPLDKLADYIVKKHHRYVEKKISELSPYLKKVFEVHGKRHPELFDINLQFKAASGRLLQHMKKEEFSLFPFIRKMIKAQHKNMKVEVPSFGTIVSPIKILMDEHVTEGDRFKKIRKLSMQYSPPADACDTFRVTYAMLREFEEDLQKHVYLENNILFPKAIAMEME